MLVCFFSLAAFPSNRKGERLCVLSMLLVFFP